MKIKVMMALLLAIAMLAVLCVAGPALAQGATQKGAPYKGQVVAAPGVSGTPLQLETPTKEISGTAGQYVRLRAKITNPTNRTLKDTVAYVSLVDLTKGQQAPVDLEDWSAHRAITVSSLSPGQSRNVSWSLRLVKGGNYAIYANAIGRDSTRAAVGQEVPLFVKTKRNLNPGSVLPVALGVPVLAGAALFGPVFLRRRNLAV